MDTNSLKTKGPNNPRASGNNSMDKGTDSTQDSGSLPEVNYEPSLAIPVPVRRGNAAMLDDSQDDAVDSQHNSDMLAALAHHVSLSSSFPPHMHYHHPRDDDAKPHWQLPGWSLPSSNKRMGTPPDGGMVSSSEASPVKQGPASSGLSPSPSPHKQSVSLKFDRSTLHKVRRSLFSKFMKSVMKVDQNHQPSMTKVSLESGSSSKKHVSRQLQTTGQCDQREQAEHRDQTLSLTKSDQQLIDSSPLLLSILTSPEPVTKPILSLCTLCPEKLAQRRRTKSLSAVSDKLSRRPKHKFYNFNVPLPPVYPWPESTVSNTSDNENTAVPEQGTINILDTLDSTDDQKSSVAQRKENQQKNEENKFAN